MSAYDVPVIDHVRIDVPGSKLMPELFADYYRFGTPGPRLLNPPLICCWGGALYPGHYDQLRKSHPVRLVEEFAKICDHEHDSDFDVLFLPTPEAKASSLGHLRADLA